MKPYWILLSLVATLAAVAVATRLSTTADSEDSSPDSAPSFRVVELSRPVSHEANVSTVVYDTAPLTMPQQDCRDDCSGFELGYRWAAAQEIEDAEDCAGYSESFSEGCWIYAKEREEMRKVAELPSR